jgi:uncharacterized membrane protein
MNRYELDSLAAHYRLEGARLEELLDAAQARPSRHETLQFILRLLRLAGVLSLAAGVVFFIAANWDEFGVFGRFILVEAALLATVGLALYKPPPLALGKYVLLLAFILTGVLLALFGQTYQTGADTYELFLGWTVLGLLFVLAGRWGVLWGAWLLVLNVALWLYCGWRPETGWLWAIFGGWQSPHLLALGGMTVNLAAYALIRYAQRTAYAAAAPQWLARFALGGAIAFATWSGCFAIVESSPDLQASSRALALFIVAAVYIALVVHHMQERTDVFPLALIAGSTIAILTFALARALSFADASAFFLIALWLIGSSTFSGRVLMRLLREWNAETRAEVQA